jgi:hypothetical protein
MMAFVKPGLLMQALSFLLRSNDILRTLFEDFHDHPH